MKARLEIMAFEESGKPKITLEVESLAQKDVLITIREFIIWLIEIEGKS